MRKDESSQNNQKQRALKRQLSRRDMLKLSALTGVGAVAATSGVTTSLDLFHKLTTPKETHQVPFYGNHQAGIVTAQQEYGYLVAFDVTVTTRSEVVALLKDWTRYADLVTRGQVPEDSTNEMLPPNDSGETAESDAQHLTVTIGYGRSFFIKDKRDRFGLERQLPKHLVDVPHFAHDALVEQDSGGDIVLQVCADDRQVAFHAVRNFIRQASGQATVRFSEDGFMRVKEGKTPRNLFGFKDGTANHEHDSPAGYKKVVWTQDDEPDWFVAGAYLGYRKVKMLLDVWDRSSLVDQEDTFGRKKASGCPYGKHHEFDDVDTAAMPTDAHVRLARETKQQMHRRAYSYQNGVSADTNQMSAGLLFIAYMQNPEKQYFPMLKVMGTDDKMNEYTVPVANGLYAMQKGLSKGEYFGQQLFGN